MATPKKRVPGQVLDILHKSVTGKIHEPNLAELAQHFFHLAGGERAVAKMLLDQYMSPNCPAGVKAKIMQIMLGHLEKVNARSGIVDDLGLLDTTDIERELHNQMREVGQRHLEKRNVVVQHGPQAAAG